MRMLNGLGLEVNEYEYTKQQESLGEKGENYKKKKLINSILTVVKANETFISGELVFSLAFKSENELIKIAHDLHIKE